LRPRYRIPSASGSQPRRVGQIDELERPLELDEAQPPPSLPVDELILLDVAINLDEGVVLAEIGVRHRVAAVRSIEAPLALRIPTRIVGVLLPVQSPERLGIVDAKCRQAFGRIA
jgi:hypothetical protein